MKKEYAEEVAAKIIEQLQQGTAPWQKPWKPGELSLPYNGATEKEYRGINSMWLAMQGHGDPRWMTYNQANDAGAQVRKGEKGTKIVYWKFHDEEKAKDANGKPILGEDGKPKTIRVELERPRAFHAVVFNADQIDGLPPLELKSVAPEPERHARAEAILSNSGAAIQHLSGDRAFYRPSTDSITLPERSQFDSADGYYATALHELGHWTGHSSRLDRDLAHPFGSEGYAREELRAEISSLMLGERLGLGHDPGQHAAYVGSWIKALKEDPREIFRAAADAEKIASYVMAYEKVQEQERAQGIQATPAVSREIARIAEMADRIVRMEARQSALEGDGSNRTIDHALDGQIADARYALDDAIEDTPELVRSAVALAGEPGANLLRDALMRKTPEPAQEQSEPHYSDKTLQALVEDHGWEAIIAPGLNGGMSVRRQFEGVGPTGTMVTPNGERNLYAGYNADPERRRYIALTLGDTTIADLDGRDSTPAEVARLINLKAEQFADDRRVKHGLEPIYAVDSPALELPVGDPMKLQQEAFAVEQYDAQRRQKANDPEAELRALWGSQGVSKERQDALIAEIEEKAKPGAQVGPFVIPGGEQLAADAAIDYSAILTPKAERHILHSVLAAQYEGHSHAIIEAGGILAEFGDSLTPEQYAAVDWEKAEATVMQRLAVVEEEIGLGAGTDRAEPDPVRHVAPEKPMPDRTYLAVPYAEKDQAKATAKAAGFKLEWDKENKAWFAPAGADLSKMEKWKADSSRVQTPTTKSVEDQFADALKGAGLIVDGVPVMDGKIHRVPVDGDRSGELSGAYAGHLTGHLPGGYIHNYKTGEVVNWKAEGAREQTTPEERAQLAAEAVERQQQREADVARKQEATAAAAAALWQASPAATADNAYCKEKGITNPAGLRVVPESIPEDVAKAHSIQIAKTVGEAKAMRERDPAARVFKTGDLLVPGRDLDGKLWTLQSVNPAFKSFMKGGRKHGVMAIAAGNDEGRFDSADKLTDAARPIIVAEGLATADTAAKLAGQPVIVAFDSGNLDAVIREVRAHNPDRTILIAADNDHLNKGVEKALANFLSDGSRGGILDPRAHLERQIERFGMSPIPATALIADGFATTDDAETLSREIHLGKANVGLEKAAAVAKAHGAGVIAPQFQPGEKGSDWNDRATDKGEEEARREFAAQMAVAKRDATINAERLTALAHEREQEARNDPTTSADDAAVAAERGKAADMIASAGEQLGNVRAAAADGKAASKGGRPSAASVKASLDRKNADLQDDTKRERQDVQNNAQTVTSDGKTVATRQGVVIAEQRRIDIAGDKPPASAKAKRARDRGMDAGM